MRDGYTKLRVTKVAARTWQLLEDWHTPFGKVPRGTISNGANVPRPLWWVMSPAGVLFEAAIFHDCYYDKAWGTKEDTDKAFKEIALAFGTHKILAHLSYLAVKWLGKGNY